MKIVVIVDDSVPAGQTLKQHNVCALDFIKPVVHNHDDFVSCEMQLAKNDPVLML